MKMTRGAFVEVCVMAMTAVAAGVSPVIGRSLRIGEATPETFTPHVGSMFTVDGLRLTLSEVAVRPASRHIEQFSLIFRGPADDPLSDGNHRVTHAALGTFDLSITAVGMRRPDRRTYQAVFTRLLAHTAAQSLG